MGVGVCATASIPKQDGRAPTRDALLAAVRAAVEGAVTEPALEPYVEFFNDEHALRVTLHPHAEPLTFEWSPDQRLSAMVKTSTTGPGFHAFVVEIMDRVSEACGLVWEWEEDPAEYSSKRDFGALQAEMAAFLQSLAGALLKHASQSDGTSLAINFDAGGAMPELPGVFSVTPSGPRSREWWEGAERGEELLAKGEEFYQWWGREIDATWHAKLGLAFMWSDVRWHPPANDYEEGFFRLVLDTFNAAQELDPSLALPEAELHELAEMLKSSPEEASIPGKGIGYFRGPVTFRLPGGWSIKLPGYFYEDDEDDGGTALYWHRDKTVRLTSYTVRNKEGAPVPADRLLETCRGNLPEGTRAIEFTDTQGMRCFTAFGQETDDDGRTFLVMHGGKAKDGQVAQVTICFDDEASQAWATEVFKSITPPGEDEVDE
jgi:hypothetical protein